MWLLIAPRLRAKHHRKVYPRHRTSLSFDVDPGLTISLVKNSGGLETMLFFLFNLSDVPQLRGLIFFFLSWPPLILFTEHEAPHSCTVLYTTRQIEAGRLFLLIIRPASIPRSYFGHICSCVESSSTKNKKNKNKKMGKGKTLAFIRAQIRARRDSRNCFSLKRILKCIF